jgi:hypothetical protein
LVLPFQYRRVAEDAAISAGLNVKAVPTLLWHPSAVMTLDQYRHLMSDDLTNVAKSLNDAATLARKLAAV